MEIGNGATLEMVENLLDGSTPAGRALQADSAGSAATATNAAHADSADTATKASQDGSGNNIAATYATKSELAASGGGSGGFDASGTYPELTAGKAQNVETLYAHYLHGVDTRGGSGQYIYWNTVIVSGEAAAIEEITAADLRAMGYEEGDSFPVSGYIDRGGNGANGAVVGLRLLTNDYLAVEYVDGEGNFVQFPVASALSVDSPEQNGRDVVRRLQ